MKLVVKALWCIIFHRRCFGDYTWEVVRLPSPGGAELPALWRVWVYCRKCGRGWTKWVEQAGTRVKWIPRSKPLPGSPEAAFFDPSRLDKGEEDAVDGQEMVDSKEGD